MASYHLRPIHDGSTSPTASTSTASERSPPSTAPTTAAEMIPPQTNTSAARSRRPLSPSSLRDVDLPTPGSETGPRKYPAPPTGHELMALFPPSPPTTMRPGPTSGFFEREERAFFARKGKEIVHVHIEVDMGPGGEDAKAKARDPGGVPRAWPQGHAHALPPVAGQASPNPPLHPIPFPQQNARARAAPVQPGTFPAGPPTHPSQPAAGVNARSPPGMHRGAYPVRGSPREHHLVGAPGAAPLDGHVEPEFQDDPDEAWRRPIPHSERRRAGKHTKRVIVK
ncbi:hypothetical protein CERSUDRAFT_120250 [Gelatoporia subvermispora B]|uniref:Uncharacterized protein n=1 Tax=Ceriporiopsis subvermispora (strain B) TaxID=914234 RepID=M2QYB2_CERS8|nr:hypothetical protein CERSUDRAFT_120250 [Gelatoporia subvermispora B]